MFCFDRIIFLLKVVLMIHVNTASGALKGVWDNDVYTGRHWEDLVTQSTVYSPEVIQPSLLVIYEPRCEADITQSAKLVESNMPSAPYLFFGKYDNATTLKYIWYDIDDRDNLTKRYNTKNCPDYLFFANGSSVFQPDVYNRNSGVSILDWLWGKFAVAFHISNYRQGDIVVDIRGQRQQVFVLKAGEVQTIQTFVSNVILITDLSNGQFIHAMVIEPKVTSLTVIQTMEVKDSDKSTWYNAKRGDLDNFSTQSRTWIWGIAGNYLRNFKQPLLLPMFTKEGYYKTKMPETLYGEIMTFYQENTAHRKYETQPTEPLINENDVRCTIVQLSANMVKHIGATLKPLMEAWSNVSLELTRLYGIREYYRGNILRNHVDQISTHVISAILQIDQEMVGQPDWELEFVTRDGKRRQTSLQPGEMLFYESATIIHGRPLPLQGKMYANAFLHYKPVDNWKWHMHPDGHWIMHDGDPKDMLDQLVTPITKQKPKFYYHDEL